MATTTTTKQPKADPKAPAKQKPDAKAEEAAASPKKKRSLLKIVLLLTLLLGGAGGGAWYFLQDHEPAASGKPVAAKAATAKAVPVKAPVFANLEPFTVNLQHEDASPQYLQVGLVLKVADAAVADAVKLHTPEIRNRVLLLLSGKKASEISTSEGKQSLSKELMREISQPLAGSVPATGIDSVLFTSFVIQ
jgi:flagellar FliL protein